MCRPVFRGVLGVLGVAVWPHWALAQANGAAVPTASANGVAAPSAASTEGANPTAAPQTTTAPAALSATSETPQDNTAPTVTDQSGIAAGNDGSVTPPTTDDGASGAAATSEQFQDAATHEGKPADETPLDETSNATLADDEPSVKKQPDVDVGLRVIGGFRYRKRELDEDATYGFQARQVRASLKLKLGKRLFTRMSVELTDGIGSGSGVRFLRTAVLEYRQSKALRLAVGRFKRPFSYLQLQSTADLPVLDRGLLNSVVVEDSAWGDRGIGAMASGKIKDANLGWALALTNPSPDALPTQGIDTIARVTWSPMDEFTIGINGGNKYLDFDQGRKHFQAVGGDVTLKVGGLEWQLEGVVADRPWQQAVAFGGTSLLSYTHRLSKNWQLQPVVFAEYADANAEFGRNESVRLQSGINAIIRDQLRIMPQYKLTTPIGDPLLSAPTSSPEYNAINPWTEGYELSLLISLVL